MLNLKKSSLPFPTLMCNVDEPNKSPSKTVNMAPRDSQTSFLLLRNLIGEHLHFLKAIHQE